MFAQISYANVVTTDTAVDAIGTVVQLTPSVRQANRSGVEITNCTTGTVKIAQTSGGAPTLESGKYDTILVSGATKTYGAMPSVKFYAFSDAAGTVRMVELI